MDDSTKVLIAIITALAIAWIWVVANSGLEIFNYHNGYNAEQRMELRK